jgi:hypothetical protein
MLVLPEVIVNGIESVSVLDVYVGAETLTFAGVSVNVPAYGPVAGPEALKVTLADPLKQYPPAPARNVVAVA